MYSEEILHYLGDLLGIDGTQVRDSKGKRLSAKLAKIPKSSSYVFPGDLVLFYYDNPDPEYSYNSPKDHLLLIASLKRSSRGLFTSTKNNNKLLFGFKLNDKLPETTRAILKALYKNRSKCDYTRASSALGYVLKRTYRTYIISNMSEYSRLTIHGYPD